MNDALDHASTYMEFFLVMAGVVSTIYGFVRFSTKRLEEKIIEMTKPIQPGTNGGLSLSDLHGKLDTLKSQVDVMEKRQIAGENLRHEILQAADHNQHEWIKALRDQGVQTPDEIDFTELEG